MADSPSDKLAAEEFANAPILGPGHDFASVTDKISAIVLSRRHAAMVDHRLSQSPSPWSCFSWCRSPISSLPGVGIWGIQIPVGWGFAIINFVWWIGIGHAGTLISAILLLLRQQWRTSINRFAEAMTLFAVSCAGIFPLIHMGRPWLAYWLFPYPDTMKMWPNFRSPLVWDAFAVSTYATVSLLFWFIGLHSGPCHASRPREKSPGEIDLRLAGNGMARLGGSLGKARDGFFVAGRSRYTAGAFRAHDREF